MAHALNQIPVSRITDEARQVRFGRTLLAAIAGMFYVVGWVAAKTVGVLWFALVWVATAVKIGWQDARKDIGNGAS